MIQPTGGARRRRAVGIVGLVLVVGALGAMAAIARQARNARARALAGGRAGTAESRRDVFRALAASGADPTAGAVDLVLVGDSLVATAEWGELMRGRAVRNRGVAGDRVRDVLGRIDDAVAGEPRAVLIAVGINDLLDGDRPEAVAAGEASIVARVRQRCPRARILLEGVLPIRRETDPAGPAAADAIPRLNDALRRLAAEQRVSFVDAGAALADGTGELDRRFTTDGVHLTGAGYLRWLSQIEGALGQPPDGRGSGAAGGASTTAPVPSSGAGVAATGAAPIAGEAK
ncbi:MAG TPA: GDSL-type esterase/lipase family protein [Polyangia bacterium]|nr:GDSL-type esterase/lipase family protein [Polyangia bacterium]